MKVLQPRPDAVQPRRPRNIEVRFVPTGLVAPARQLAVRMLVSMALVGFVAALVLLDRSGYNDVRDGSVGVLDAFYYATVTITTTGYGDIVPATDTARAITTALVTPARIAFLVLLVGTSLELIAAATRSRMRTTSWRKSVKDHIVICGYGVKGRAVLDSLEQQGIAARDIVVVDRDSDAIDDAVRDGHIGIQGDMTSNRVLDAAMVQSARVVVITPTRDDTAVLTVLSTRMLNADARVVAAAREFENAELLRRSGASTVLTSSGATGQMLGLATSSPHAIEVLEDLLELQHGFDLVERSVDTSSGSRVGDWRQDGELVLAVFRDGRIVSRAPAPDFPLSGGDSVVSIITRDEAAAE